jgi:hypothetical protein
VGRDSCKQPLTQSSTNRNAINAATSSPMATDAAAHACAAKSSATTTTPPANPPPERVAAAALPSTCPCRRIAPPSNLPSAKSSSASPPTISTRVAPDSCSMASRSQASTCPATPPDPAQLKPKPSKRLSSTPLWAHSLHAQRQAWRLPAAAQSPRSWISFELLTSSESSTVLEAAKKTRSTGHQKPRSNPPKRQPRMRSFLSSMPLPTS